VTSPQRRRFDHFVIELSLALGERVPRHALWLACARHLDSASALSAFCRAGLGEFLASVGANALDGRAGARLLHEIARFDPARRTPEEVFGALFGARV
jgi:hypothetical protein